MEYFSFFLCIQDNQFYTRFVSLVNFVYQQVGSAAAQEAVNHVLSRIKEGYAGKSDAK
jgi:hypothetical protein